MSRSRAALVGALKPLEYRGYDSAGVATLENQLAVLSALALAAGRARGVLSETDEKTLVRALIEVPSGF